jgi:hypothetical protein
MEEQGKDFFTIIERLTRLEVMQQKDLDVAEDWRKIFCAKLDKLTTIVVDLPCDKREGRWLSITTQTKWLWIAMTFLTGLNGIFIAALINHIGKTVSG